MLFITISQRKVIIILDLPKRIHLEVNWEQSECKQFEVERKTSGSGQIDGRDTIVVQNITVSHRFSMAMHPACRALSSFLRRILILSI